MVFFAILKVSLYFNIFAMPDTTIRSNTEVVLIGAGIMSATLGLILKELQPDIKLKSSKD
jgi:malate dehydrogenase (quinone)